MAWLNFPIRARDIYLFPRVFRLNHDDILPCKKKKERELGNVRRELGEYLEEPLVTFTKIEGADNHERVAVFGILGYWQVSKPFLPRYGCPTRTSPCKHLFSSAKETYTACRNRLQPKLMESPSSTETIIPQQLARLNRAFIISILPV